MSQQALLSDETRRRIEGLAMQARRLRLGAQKGERRSLRRGTSLEFADYREYSPGDDLRQLDWNVYARQQRPMVKIREDEDDLAVHLLLDRSTSMALAQADEDRPEAGQAKWRAALAFAAALGYVSLGTGDRLALHSLGAPTAHFVGRGRRQLSGFLRALDALRPDSPVGLAEGLRTFALRERRRGLVWLISDLYADPPPWDELNALLAQGHELVIIHWLSPSEHRPVLHGELRLLDGETGQARDMTLDAALLAAYQRQLHAWSEAWRQGAARRGAAYLLADSATPTASLLLVDLRRLSLLR
ncbi:MAG: DUF58 domain-containing protein [Anaerolineae bacterium]|nr:DUF58 domain-containing protein [Anaerolineae bacterium]MDW8172616.1 DUF58 domain-containing protein [Anaerolineae bacterium]